MSGSRAKVKNDRVTVSAMVTSDVEVEIDPIDLIQSGWLREEDVPDLNEAVISAVESWHNYSHVGSFLWCNEQPCNDVVKASGK